MAYRNTRTAQEAAPKAGNQQQVKILGYLNVGLPTKQPGKFRRVESIRLMENKAIHVQVFNHLNLSREEDAKITKGLDDAALAALYKERLDRLQGMIQLTFNPSPDESEAELDL